MNHRIECGFVPLLENRKRKHRTPDEKAVMQAAAKLWLLDEHPDLAGTDDEDHMEAEHALKKARQEALYPAS